MLYETGNYSSLVAFENYVCGSKRNFLADNVVGRFPFARNLVGIVPGACARELKAAYSDRDWRATDDVRRTTMFSPHIHHQQPRLSHILNRITKPFASQA